MTYPTPEMVVSGVPYLVVEVEGREPSDLADFVTATLLGTPPTSDAVATVLEGAAHVEG